MYCIIWLGLGFAGWLLARCLLLIVACFGVFVRGRLLLAGLILFSFLLGLVVGLVCVAILVGVVLVSVLCCFLFCV